MGNDREIMEKESKDVQDLVCSCERIEGELGPEILEGSFRLENCRGNRMKGYLICTDPRMSCSPSQFEGEKAEIHYQLETRQASLNEPIKGVVCIITDCGELELPYVFSPINHVLNSSLGEIRNLFHFANLARTGWDEAVKLFFHSDFEKILSAARQEERQLYRGLKETGNEQCVEEFLLAVRKKTPVTYSLETDLIERENIEENQKIECEIQKKGWGYTLLGVEKEGDFLSLEKDTLRDTDFMGNICKLPVYLRADRLHQGKNYGRIHFHHAYGEFTLTVVVCQNQHHRMHVAIEKRRSLKQMRTTLTGLFVDFRLKKISAPAWRKETEGLLEKMRAADERSFQPKLFMAHLHITSQKLMEAKWLLDRVSRQIQDDKDPVSFAYYLYLTTLIDEDEEYHKRVQDKVKKLYYTRQQDWKIAWLWLYLSREFHSSAQKKWDFLREIFLSGCTSPVLYAEAVLLLNYQPTLLMELGETEKRILRFGQKKGMLSDEVKGVLQYLSLREKEYSESLADLLQKICAGEDNPSMLQALCSLLIKGDKKENRYFIWYEKAVLAGLKITRLFEYYMMSLDREKRIPIPKAVLIYFSYESSLSYPNAAYLYRYVYENREAMEEMYLAYAPRMERFVVRQLYAQKITPDLAWLYERLLVSEMLTFDNARALEKLLFLGSFEEKDPRIEKLIVVSRHLDEETVYRLNQSENEIFLPGKNYILLKEDVRGQRFVVSQEEYPRPFLNAGVLLPRLRKIVEEAFGIALYLCEEAGGWQSIDQENEPHFRFLAASGRLLVKERQELSCRLLDYYYEEEEMGRLDTFLEECEADALQEKDRTKLIHYLIARGYYEKACSFVQRYGADQMDPKSLVRISTYILEEEGQKLPIMLWFADTAFEKGKYNVAILNCLLNDYRGSSRRMEAVFKAARDFELDVYPICERLLQQMLYSGTDLTETVDIFKAYVSGGAKTSIETAVLSRYAKAYLAEQCEIDEYLIRAIARVHKRTTKLEPGIGIAYLKYYALHKEEREHARGELLYAFLREAVLEKEWIFPFVLEYRDYPGMEILADKAWITQLAEGGSRLVLHYTRGFGENQKEAYLREPMKEFYEGMFGKEFILFYGEEMKYYITREQENKEQLIHSGILKHNDHGKADGSSRFQMINRMAAGQILGDYTKVDELLEEYWRMQHIVDAVFHL